MNQINRQIVHARRRLNLVRFGRILGWSMFAGLMLAAVGLTIPKIWHLLIFSSAAGYQNWVIGWICGGAVLGLLAAGILTWKRHVDGLSAALEIDHRFALKERLSSAVSLDATQAGSRAGTALVADAADRAEKIDVRDQFGLRLNWRVLLPLLPIGLLVGLSLLPNAVLPPAQASQADEDKRQQIQVAVQAAREKLREKIQQMETKGLKDAKLALQPLDRQLDKLSPDSTTDKKDALVTLNDIKKQLEDRQRALGDAEELKKQLSQLKQVSQGPAKQLAEAMASGEFDEARKVIKDLAAKLKTGKLNAIEQQQLAKDLAELAKELEKMARKHEQAKQDLQQKIQQAHQKGDLEQAAKLQNQLEKLQQQDNQMQQMQKMADKLRQCGKCMNPGNKQGKQGQQNANQSARQDGSQQAQARMSEAGQALEDLAEQMEQMQQELDELEALEDMAQQISNCKNAINGCPIPGDMPNWNDWADGEGPGGGKRDKLEGQTGAYRSRVKGKLQPGETVVTGHADGDNISGNSVTEARELVKASMSKNADPLENQKLPRAQREHVRQYFESLRKGK